MLAARAAIAGLVALLAAGAARALPVETTTDLNLRAGPGVAYPALATMPAGEIVHVDVCVESWCRVFYRGYPGWASGRHLARLPDRPFPWEGAARARQPWPFDEPFEEPYVEPFLEPFEDAYVEPLEVPEMPAAPDRRAPMQAPPPFDEGEEPGRLAVIAPLPPRAPDRSPAPAPIEETPAEAPAVAAQPIAPPDRAPLYREGPVGAGGRDVL
jgi:hypothetical protein